MTDVVVANMAPLSGFSLAGFNLMAAPPPPLTLQCASSGTGQVGVPFNSSLTATGGVPPYSFSIIAGSLPPGLTLNASTGAITGTPTTAGTFNFTAQVMDSSGNAAGNTATSSCSIVISPAPPPSNVCSLTWGFWKNHVSAWPVTSLTLGCQTYSQTELINILHLPVAGDASIDLAHQLIAAKFNVLNGTNPATAGNNITTADQLLCQFAGKLPYGVSPSSPTGQQMASTASNLDDFNSDGKLQPGCVAPGSQPPLPISLACATNTGQVNASYSSGLVVSGGVGPYTFSITSGALPPGLTLNTLTGAITGKPTMAGPFSFTAKVVDSTGTAAGTTTANCTITISNPPPSPLALACATSSGQVGVAYNSALVASGGVAPYTFSITSGALPTGLNLNTSTGAITGTPGAAGPFNFTAQVLDSSGNPATNSVTGNCGISIAPQSSSNACGLTWGYWKNHTNVWGATSLVLGSQTYLKSELITILQTPVKGDASMDLAHQLIAAKLNVLNGTNIATAGNNITTADQLLSLFPGKLPYGVSASSATGQQMTAAASNLDDFNSDGKLQPGCVSTAN